MVVVSLLNGTVMFLSDLIRNLALPLRLDFIGVSSYGAGTESGDLVFTKELRLNVRGRDVLLVDDILDTGKTLSRVLGKIRALKPRRIKTCVLLNKAARRVETVEADYVGFEIPDFFVVGYGLDFAERYRNLPFVGVLHPHVYKQASKQVKPARPQKAGGRVSLTSSSDCRRLCSMRVTVCFYSYFKDLTGCARTTEELPGGSTLDDLFRALVAPFPQTGHDAESNFDGRRG
jgi:hypoxanthine phosphoribosyltransferase